MRRSCKSASFSERDPWTGSRQGSIRFHTRFILAMHVEPVMFRPQIKYGRHSHNAEMTFMIAQLLRRVRRDVTQRVAEVPGKSRLFRLHDSDNRSDGAVDECGGDRRI